ncbi:MAG: hypothetical protein COB36_02335 [Alphaproteobacteria bacterium]|nr:MAG: hypothetical protein COB36_02335 [Alphaproteobacteria bacterium]
MKNPKQTLLNGIASTAVVFMSACSTLPELKNTETPKPETEVCIQEANEECTPTDRIIHLRESILKGEKIKNIEGTENVNTASIIEPE